ncbi:GntR family transcriptional regulator [Rhodococcus opacus]|jgi:DNA-binding GntR family transcriptional regulator|uniref:GntR family transcriptional regulator n=1 Tax=Rhodococcus opacus TaxID=37919 RepID=UPI001F5779CE|nr:GntR family transcriptional regulator [Rhodococcus opacus]MDH6286484.1 DNA-binding GntR family transcriptional regulator [Rhodococcus opacus]UNM99136.1 GntR family transcriptional regulator [Rhodococcus opacus]UZG54995.1 GntR family transcriptional regulator [Rhodococcus opacus]
MDVATSRRLDTSNFQERAADGLRQMIISGELAPGQSLSEVSLAETFGISRTPIREALKQLQIEGLVEIRPRVGTFVAVPSRREINELFEMKQLLEGGAARLMAARGDVPELTAMKANVREADAAVEAGDTERYAQLVHDFHEILIAGADNGKLATHYRLLMNQLAYGRLVKTSLSQPGRSLESEREHHTVLELIIAKDGIGAENYMRRHVQASQQALMSQLDS